MHSVATDSQTEPHFYSIASQTGLDARFLDIFIHPTLFLAQIYAMPVKTYKLSTYQSWMLHNKLTDGWGQTAD